MGGLQRGSMAFLRATEVILQVVYTYKTLHTLNKKILKGHNTMYLYKKDRCTIYIMQVNNFSKHERNLKTIY